jgi:hypothetical protein
MGVKCPTCSADNRSGAKFCFVCGTDLTAISPLTPSVPQIQPTTLMSTPPGVPPASKACLVMADGTSLDLEQRTVIGRDASVCSLSFPQDTQLSRKHAVIEEVSGNWTIEDLNSSNGTYVNAQRLQGAVGLKPGDRIGMGSTEYVFTVGGQGAASQLALLPNQNIMPAQPVSSMMPLQQIGPTPISQAPPGGWRNWNAPPAAEGYVRIISPVYHMKKDDLLKRGIAAAALAIFISPVVAFIPMMQGNEISARDLRIEDRISGHMVDIKILGDMFGNINTGDCVAVWGQVKGGLLLMEVAFNYATESEIRMVKR